MCALDHAQTLHTLVPTLSLPELLGLIAALPIPSVRHLERLFADPGCTCRVPPSEDLDSLPLSHDYRCEHTEDSGQWVLPAEALAALCARLPEYAEPDGPETPSIAVVRSAKVGVYAQRHRDGLGLRHPRDLKAEDEAIDDVERSVSRQNHGSGWGRLVIGEPTAATAKDTPFEQWRRGRAVAEGCKL